MKSKNKLTASAGRMTHLVRFFFCLTGNHRFKETQKLTEASRRVACPDCGGVWAMNDDTRILADWDADFHRLYERNEVTIKYLDWEFRKPNA